MIVLTKMSSSSSSIPSIPKAPEPTVGHSRHRSKGRARGSSDRPMCGLRASGMAPRPSFYWFCSMMATSALLVAIAVEF